MLAILIHLIHGGKWNASIDNSFKIRDAVITVHVARELYSDISAYKATIIWEMKPATKKSV